MQQLPIETAEDAVDTKEDGKTGEVFIDRQRYQAMQQFVKHRNKYSNLRMLRFQVKQEVITNEGYIIGHVRCASSMFSCEFNR